MPITIERLMKPAIAVHRLHPRGDQPSRVRSRRTASHYGGSVNVPPCTPVDDDVDTAHVTLGSGRPGIWQWHIYRRQTTPRQRS